MDALKTPLLSASGKSAGTVEWPAELLSLSPSLRVLHEVIVGYQANRRSGTSDTKSRGEVRGGGRKPWKQKGTGNARSGSIRSPLWRKGGVIFGPKPRSYRQELSESKRLIALQTALLEKVKTESLAVLDGLGASPKKTGEVAEALSKAGVHARAVLVVPRHEPAVDRLLRNIDGLEVVAASDLNAFDVAKSRQVVVLKDALLALAQRFPKG